MADYHAESPRVLQLKQSLKAEMSVGGSTVTALHNLYAGSIDAGSAHTLFEPSGLVESPLQLKDGAPGGTEQLLSPQVVPQAALPLRPLMARPPSSFLPTPDALQAVLQSSFFQQHQDAAAALQAAAACPPQAAAHASPPAHHPHQHQHQHQQPLAPLLDPPAPLSMVPMAMMHAMAGGQRPGVPEAAAGMIPLPQLQMPPQQPQQMVHQSRQPLVVPPNKADRIIRGPDPARFYCPYPGCDRSFAELWRLKVHHRAPPGVRGSGVERGHGCELKWCPKCGQDLKPGKHHVGCSAGKSAPRQAAKRQRQQASNNISAADSDRGSSDQSASNSQVGPPPAKRQASISPAAAPGGAQQAALGRTGSGEGQSSSGAAFTAAATAAIAAVAGAGAGVGLTGV